MLSFPQVPGMTIEVIAFLGHDVFLKRFLVKVFFEKVFLKALATRKSR
jgi:hypothetical protein